MHTLARKKTLLFLAVATSLCALAGWGVRQLTKTVVIGLQLTPHPAGAIACSWTDASGAAHPSAPLPTGTGRVSFRVPCQAALVRFTFSPAAEPYRVKALTLYQIPCFSAQWLNNMVNPDEPVYIQQYLGSRDPLEIQAPTEISLCYARFFSLLLRLFRLLHVFAPLIAALLYFCLIVLWLTRAQTSRSGHFRCPAWASRCAAFAESAPVLSALIPVAALLTLPFPVFPTTPGLDPSWGWLLNHFALNPAGIGETVFFTYGPLGFTFAPHAIGQNALVALACNVFYAICLVLTLIAVIRLLPDSRKGVGYLLVCTLLLPSIEWRWPVLILLTLLLCCHLPESRKRELVFFSVLAGGLICYSILLKFTLAIIAGLCIAMALAFMTVFKRKALPVFLAALSCTLLTGMFLARWKLFLSFGSMARWAAVSWDVAAGYNTAMVTQVSAAELIIPCVFAASYLLLLVPLRHCTLTRLGLLLLVSPLIFFSYKYSMTRAGVGAIRAVAYVMPCVTAMLIMFSDPGWRPRVSRLFVLHLVAGLGVSVLASFFLQAPLVGASISNLRDTVLLKQSVERAKIQSRQALAPVRFSQEWLTLIGTNTFSSFPTELAYAPANQLNFVPFPVLQGYSAYTCKLDTLGAHLFTSSCGPEWLLCHFYNTDQRNLLIDSPAVWNAIKRHYRLLTADGACLLLKRTGAPQPFELRAVRTVLFAPGEWFDLSSADVRSPYVSLEWRATFLGKVLSLVLRNTTCSLTVERADGEVRRWRLVPDTARTPFAAGAIPFDRDEFRRIFTPSGQQPFPVKRLKFDCEHPWFYQKRITLTLHDKSG